MKRLIVISNRLPAEATAGGDSERARSVGGLATALHAAMKRAPESLWIGWNGRIVPAKGAGRLTRHRLEGVDLIGFPMTHGESADHYQGFCNEVIWPLFHCFQGRVRVEMRQRERYESLNQRVAMIVRKFLRPGDLVWVHDYHFLLLGRELRRLGWSGRTGFFLHIPFPPLDLFEILPGADTFLSALAEFDTIGFHTHGYLDNYVYACRRLLGATWDGATIAVGGRRQRAGAYPIGIDPAAIRRWAGEREAHGRDLARVVRGRRLILGVDRLDYTKGIEERVLALEHFFQRYTAWRKKVSYVQIAAPSRSRIPQYAEQKRQVEALVGRVNSENADHDWVPIRYLYRSYTPATLARFFRQSDVGLVTPLRDGMNLVAKEFVAAQDPAYPGVLVLSRFAGAAERMSEAILVNPYVPAETADGIARALAMPIEERRERHAALLARVEAETAETWARRFIADLDAPASKSPQAQVGEEGATRRSPPRI